MCAATDSTSVNASTIAARISHGRTIEGAGAATCGIFGESPEGMNGSARLHHRQRLRQSSALPHRLDPAGEAGRVVGLDEHAADGGDALGRLQLLAGQLAPEPAD